MSRGLVFGLAFGMSMAAATCFADDTKKDDGKRKDNHQSPFRTIWETRLWNNPPPPKDFVIEHRPDKSRLKFQPVTGTDPERPKPRTPAELKDLETELETARVATAKKGGLKPDAATTSSKPKPASATQ